MSLGFTDNVVRSSIQWQDCNKVNRTVWRVEAILIGTLEFHIYLKSGLSHRQALALFTSPDTARRSHPAARGCSGWWSPGSGGRAFAAPGGPARRGRGRGRRARGETSAGRRPL